MGSGESTSRRVSFGLDEDDRVRILRGVKVIQHQIFITFCTGYVRLWLVLWDFIARICNRVNRMSFNGRDTFRKMATMLLRMSVIISQIDNVKFGESAVHIMIVSSG